MNTHLMFAYGSNMSEKQMTERCPSAVKVSTYELKDFDFCFPHVSIRRKCGVMSVKPSKGSSVWGVVYAMSSDDLIKLDVFEGLGQGYTRKFHKEGGFWYYYSLKNGRNEFHPPSKEYLGIISEAARALPDQSYISRLNETVTLEN